MRPVDTARIELVGRLQTRSRERRKLRTAVQVNAGWTRAPLSGAGHPDPQSGPGWPLGEAVKRRGGAAGGSPAGQAGASQVQTWAAEGTVFGAAGAAHGNVGVWVAGSRSGMYVQNVFKDEPGKESGATL